MAWRSCTDCCTDSVVAVAWLVVKMVQKVELVVAVVVGS